MKSYLLHGKRDFDLKAPAPAQWPALCKDLQLDIFLDSLEENDKRVRAILERALFLAPSNDLQTIARRQGALKDSLRNPEIVRELYLPSQEAADRRHRVWGHFHDT